jgi:hypothetical protein
MDVEFFLAKNYRFDDIFMIKLQLGFGFLCISGGNTNLIKR